MTALHQPTVSVIIPAFNAEGRLGRLLQSLVQQQYPRELLEILVVDNGSTDRTRDIAAEFPVRVLSETRLQNPGSARNAGVAEATGEVIAFIDADCVASPTWIAEAVHTLDTESAALVAGDIQWVFSSPPRAAEIFDSLVHLRNDIHARENGTAVTANLVVRSEVFKKTGPFPAWKAGEDYTFCIRAREAGYLLVFGEKAVVVHETRKLRSLLRKAWRVGGFQRHLCSVSGDSDREFYRSVLTAYIPGHPKHVRRLMRARGTPEMEQYLLRVWMISYVYNLFWGTAALLSGIRGVTIDPV